MNSDDYYGIINADCDAVLRQMVADGVKYDLILTDPPYNVGKDFGNKSDMLPLGEFLEGMYRRIDLLRDLLSDRGSIIWFGIHDYICYIQVYMYSIGLHYRRMNIWHYENGFSRSTKTPATHYEPFLWFSKSDRHWTYNVDEVRVPYKSTERLKSPVRYTDSHGNTKTWVPSGKGAMRGDVWDFPTLAGKAFAEERTPHPAQKPEALITELLKAFCPMEDGRFCGTVLDPFHGSGTLGVCCEKLNKAGHAIRWTGIEIERKWCDIAAGRLERIR